MRTLGDIQPGQTLGRYEFLVPIAQGGMAAVWAARLKGSRGFSKTVAVKTMLPAISDDPSFEQMFLDEATIASRIVHPNVVQILDLGEQDDILYLVMEWVDGEPLSSVRRAAAKRDGIPVPIAVKIVQDAAAGLHAAHELMDESGKHVGLVHRDISPQNILITYQGVVKIVDFGVAKAAGRTTENTSAGQVKGKPPYMSPEQALGKEIDRRTDVFALGILLYQLTTGKHPFRGESDMVTLQNIVSDRPIVPPRAYDKEYPKALEAVVLKALQRDPGVRFQTAADLEGALDRVFPPRMGRIRREDVGQLVGDLLGERGTERRDALKEAIRVADERAEGRDVPVTAVPIKALDDIGSHPGDSGRSSYASLHDLPKPAASDPRASVTVVDRPSNPDAGSPEFADQYTLPDTPAYRAAISSDGDLHSSAPTTPFSASSPAHLAPRSSSKGLLIGLAGLGVGVVAIVAALVLTRTPKADPVTAAPAPELAPTASAQPAPAAEPVSAPPVASDGPAEVVVDPTDLALAKKNTPGASHGPSGAKPGAVAPAVAAPPKPAAEKAKEPGKKPGGKPGFVPPPVSDPGF